jgi:hypothetical protein
MCQNHIFQVGNNVKTLHTHKKKNWLKEENEPKGP